MRIINIKEKIGTWKGVKDEENRRGRVKEMRKKEEKSQDVIMAIISNLHIAVMYVVLLVLLSEFPNRVI